MAFHQPAVQRVTSTALTTLPTQTPTAELPQTSESQEWILFSPSTRSDTLTHQTDPTNTAGLSRASEPGYFNSIARSIQPDSILDDDATEDAELDSLDDGLHAFRETLVHTSTHQSTGPILPAHDGLGSFQASSAPVLEQLWQYEQFNSKRKYEGHHRRSSSVQRYLDTIDELDAQAGEEKRLRIEKWRMEQSQALLDEVEKETRRLSRRSSHQTRVDASVEEILGTTPKQSDFARPPLSRSKSAEQASDNEPLWRKITRKFIQDIIGIDEPLLSVILGESLPGEYTPRATSPVPDVESSSSMPSVDDSSSQGSWRDKLLQRIANELGVFPYQLNPHPGAFTTYSTTSNYDYAGMPVSLPSVTTRGDVTSTTPAATQGLSSSLGPNFPPTLRDDDHAESWGLEEEPVTARSEMSLNLQKEREFWERQLDVKMVFTFLKDRFTSRRAAPTQPLQQNHKDDSAQRAAIIRQHHPLVGRTPRSRTQVRRDSRSSLKRPSSSCASESLKGSKKASALRSGSSRNYWDIGGSAGSGSVMGTWGQV